MASQYSDFAKKHALNTLLSIKETIQQLVEWNKDVQSVDDFACTQPGMQLLAANAMLISAIGEGVNKINSKLPDFLSSNYPNVPWIDIIGMRNRIVHGYFDLDADIVLEVIKNDIPPLQKNHYQSYRLFNVIRNIFRRLKVHFCRIKTISQIF